MKKYKNIIKLSNLLLGALNELKTAKSRKVQANLEEFGCKCSEATKDSHLFHTAVKKGWLGSAETIRMRVSRNLNDFSYQLQRFKDLVNAENNELLKLSGIFDELSEIDQELGEYQFDLKEKTLSVITEPITLNDIPFGPFEIKLFIDQIPKLYTDSPYKIIALEPNPAGSNDSVTHPHVSDEKLCEGDGVVPLRKAVEQGRFYDFFTMIVSILQTYNPNSPYVSLDEWEGISCYDCGYTVSGDESYYCEDCERDYCSQCSTYCQKCDTTICLGCAYECPSCNEPVCQVCTAKCRDCEEVFCKDCLNEEGLCQNCEEQRKEDNYEESKQIAENAEAPVAVQSDSMVQTIVHA